MGLWQKSCHSPISRINVVPSAASSEISRNFSKIWETIFINLFLLLETDHFCNTIFLKRCSKACICGGNKPSQTKNRRSYFCLAVLITWCRTAFSQPLIHGVPEVASSKNKPKLHKNLRSNFRTFLLISWSWDPFCHNLL